MAAYHVLQKDEQGNLLVVKKLLERTFKSVLILIVEVMSIPCNSILKDGNNSDNWSVPTSAKSWEAVCRPGSLR